MSAGDGLDVVFDGDRVIARWLTARDQGWVESILDLLSALESRPRADVEERLARLRPEAVRWQAWRGVTRMLLSRRGFDVSSAVVPRQARRTAFLLAARRPTWPRERIVAEAAAELGIDAATLDASLHADLPERRVLGPDLEPLSPVAAIEAWNLALAKRLLLRTVEVRVELAGALGPVLRFARLQGLQVEARAPVGAGEATELVVAGPLAVHGFVERYGRALAAWLPALTRTTGWRLEALCLLDGVRHRFSASDRDPIGTTHRLTRRFDSAVEARLSRDLKHRGGPWQVLREADPVQLGGTILCPDFTLVDPARGLRVPIEVVGFWTPVYLARKVALARRLAGSLPWVLCIDAGLAAPLEAAAERSAGAPGPSFPPPGVDVLWFRGRIDVEELVALVERRAPSCPRPPPEFERPSGGTAGGGAPAEGRRAEQSGSVTPSDLPAGEAETRRRALPGTGP